MSTTDTSQSPEELSESLRVPQYQLDHLRSDPNTWSDSSNSSPMDPQATGPSRIQNVPIPTTTSNIYTESKNLEENDLVKAIEASYEDQRKSSTNARISKTVSSDQMDPMQFLMDNLDLRVSNELVTLYDPKGDTLVYIGYPSKLPHHNSSDYAHIRKHFHKILRLNSSQLKAIGSKKFGTGEGQLLGPGHCIRAKKRLKKIDIMKAIDEDVQIKYHLDLRPPSEDDEAVLLLTDLTCTQGVRTWHLAKTKYQIPMNVIMGTDELDTTSNPYHVSSNHAAGTMRITNAVSNTSTDDDIDFDPSPTSETPQINLTVSELCPLRQHSAMERLLLAICGQDPKLDSAPKVWAYFATAAWYDCARHNNINSWIEKWLNQTGNTNFVQNNPEVAYRIGMGCELGHLTRDAFSILVGEKALRDVCNELSGKVTAYPRTVHGRMLENLDDDELNRISHAASSLVRRVRDLRRSLIDDLEWLQACPKYMELRNLDSKSEAEQEIIDSTTDLIRQFCKNRLLIALDHNVSVHFSDLDVHAVDTGPFRNGEAPRFESTYGSLRWQARSFTRSFWIIMQKLQFETGNYSSTTAHILDLSNEYDARAIVGSSTISKHNITNLLMRINDFVYDRYKEEVKEKKRLAARTSLGKSSGIQAPGQQLADASLAGHCQTSPKSGMGNWISSNFKGAFDYLPNAEGLLASPKRQSESYGDQDPESPGKRRKTLEAEDESFTNFASLLDPQETAADSEALSPLTTADDNSSKNSSFAARMVYRPKSPAPADDQPTTEAGLAGLFNGQGRPPTRRMFGSDWAPANQSLAPLQYHMEDITNKAARDPGPKYVQRFDKQSGLPVYQLHDPQRFSDLQDPETSRTAYADAAIANDNASMNVHLGGTETTPPSQLRRRRAMQQFSDTEPSVPFSSPSSQQLRAEHSVPLPRSFDLDGIFMEMSRVLSQKCDEIIYPPHLFHGPQQTPINLVDTLVCLDEEEWKFLPLWAGGCDDGEGGVFNEVDVPNDDAAGFRGGKRGIKASNTANGEGSVSGSESSFDDIASDAMSSAEKASKYATDGTETVRSVREGDEASDDGFMNQDDVFEVVQQMSLERMENKGKGKGKARDWTPGDEYDFDGADDDMGLDEDGDVSTVMGAGSDVQGDFFGGDDDGDDVDATAETKDVKGKDKQAHVEDDTDDMEVIDEETL